MTKENNYSLLTQKEFVFQKIKEGIICSKWKPGGQLVERQLCEEFGVSRTPIREAFNQLAREGLVELIPQWGVFVKMLRKEEVLEMYEVREALEGLAVKLAVCRATPNDIEAIKDSLSEMENSLIAGRENIKALNEADNSFHRLLLQASHNAKLIELAAMCNIHVANLPGTKNSKVNLFVQHEALKEHKNIFECIINKLVDHAVKAIHDHLNKARKKAEFYFDNENDS